VFNVTINYTEYLLSDMTDVGRSNSLWAIVWHFCQMTVAAAWGEPKMFLLEWAAKSRIEQGMAHLR
jgi:hypothetical protein